MKPRLALAAYLLLPACNGDSSSDASWYHAEHFIDRYMIVRADPNEDSCVLVTIGTGGSVPVPDGLKGVEIIGAEAQLYGLSRGDSALRCDTGGLYVNTPVEHASGTVRLQDFVITSEGESRACTISLDLVADGIPLQRSGIPVWSPDCLRPAGYVAELVEIEAAYSPDRQELTIAGWDPTRELCAWLDFGTIDTQNGQPGLEIPQYWYAEGHVSSVVDEANCDPSTLAQEGGEGTVAVFDFEGTLAFLTSTTGVGDGYEFEIPCELDIDLTMLTTEPYYWVPNRVVFQARSLAVTGACE